MLIQRVLAENFFCLASSSLLPQGFVASCPLLSFPHFTTVPSISFLTKGITNATTAPPTMSSNPLGLAPSIPTFIAHPSHPVVTNSSPLSSPRMQLSAASSGVCPPSPSSSTFVMACFREFSRARAGEKMVAGKRV